MYLCGGTDCLKNILDGILFLSYLHIMRVNVILTAALYLFSCSRNQGNAVSLLFLKCHLLSESESVFSFSPFLFCAGRFYLA